MALSRLYNVNIIISDKMSDLGIILVLKTIFRGFIEPILFNRNIGVLTRLPRNNMHTA